LPTHPARPPREPATPQLREARLQRRVLRQDPQADTALELVADEGARRSGGIPERGPGPGGGGRGEPGGPPGDEGVERGGRRELDPRRRGHQVAPRDGAPDARGPVLESSRPEEGVEAAAPAVAG